MSGTWELLKSAFTFRLLDRAMLLAVIYPLLSLLVFWALTGRSGTLGQVVVIEPATPYWKGLAALAAIVFAVGGWQYVKWAQARWRHPWVKVANGLGFLVLLAATAFLIILDLPAFAFAAAAAVGAAAAGAAAGAFAAAAAGAFAFSVGAAGAAAVAFAAAAAAAAAGAFAAAVAVEKLQEKGNSFAAGIVAMVSPAVLVGAYLTFLPWEEIATRSSVATAIFLFLAVAPLVNAVFDFLSYAVTLALAERGRNGWPVLWGIVDAIVALILFLGLGTALVLVAAAMERISGVAFVDLGSLLAEAGDVPQYWWLYLMLFSTAVPTGIHLVLASISLQSCASPSFRNTLCKQIDRARAGSQRASAMAPLLLGLVWTLGIALVFGTVLLFGYLLWNHGIQVFLVGYRDWLFDVAVWVGGI